jgi:bacterioferritin-associated ferredoxin
MQCVQNGCAESKDLIPQVVAVAACCGACLGRSRRFLFERVTALILTILLIAYPILPGTSAGENALPFILATLLVILYCVKVVDNPWYIAAPLLSTFGLMTFTNVCDLSTVCFAALIAGVITLISVMVARSRKKVSLVTLHQPQTQS